MSLFQKKTTSIYKPLAIVKYPDTRLREPSVKIEKFDSDLKKFVFDLVSFMNAQGWGRAAGFSAVQAGSNVALFIAEGDLYINPEVLWMPTQGMVPCREGCYSLEENKFDYSVTRAYAVKLKWQDLEGEFHENKFTGWKAQVIQHEMDHLNGKLCCDLEQK